MTRVSKNTRTFDFCAARISQTDSFGWGSENHATANVHVRRFLQVPEGSVHGERANFTRLVLGWLGWAGIPDESTKTDGSGNLFRLYRSQILQVNTHVKALAEIYTIHSFAPLSNLNLLSKTFLLFRDSLPSEYELKT